MSLTWDRRTPVIAVQVIAVVFTLFTPLAITVPLPHNGDVHILTRDVRETNNQEESIIDIYCETQNIFIVRIS